MDKKFLSEYDSQEKSDFRKYQKRLLKNPSEIYPPYSRFGGVKHPIIHSEPHLYAFDKEKIWSQIPFSGSLIISLFNVPKELCLHENGFEPSDIPDLIRLAKETGKIKFALQTGPLQYEGLDYLDPILEEFKPPVLYTTESSRKIKNDLERKKWSAEFFQIASINYLKELHYNVLRNGGNEEFFHALVSGRAATWERMKILEMHDELDHLSNAIIANPEEAEALFSSYIMKTAPLFDSFTKNYSYSLSRLNRYKVDISKQSNIRIPEIGRLILNKLVINPENYLGCIDTIQKYKENDLYKLLESFEEAIRSNNADKTLDSKINLEETIDNVWQDVKNSTRQIKAVKSGLSLAFGIGGTFGTTTVQVASSSEPTASIAALGGLLAGLGFNTFESHFNVKKNISEKIVEIFKPNYLINILDFSKKYNI